MLDLRVKSEYYYILFLLLHKLSPNQGRRTSGIVKKIQRKCVSNFVYVKQIDVLMPNPRERERGGRPGSAVFCL